MQRTIRRAAVALTALAVALVCTTAAPAEAAPKHLAAPSVSAPKHLAAPPLSDVAASRSMLAALGSTSTKQAKCSWLGGTSWKYIKVTQRYDTTDVQPYLVEFTSGFPGTIKVQSWTVKLWETGTVVKTTTWNYGGGGLTSSRHNWTTPVIRRGFNTKVTATLDSSTWTCSVSIGIP